jgi:hypothetical protein
VLQLMWPLPLQFQVVRHPPALYKVRNLLCKACEHGSFASTQWGSARVHQLDSAWFPASRLDCIALLMILGGPSYRRSCKFTVCRAQATAHSMVLPLGDCLTCLLYLLLTLLCSGRRCSASYYCVCHATRASSSSAACSPDSQ